MSFAKKGASLFADGNASPAQVNGVLIGIPKRPYFFFIYNHEIEENDGGIYTGTEKEATEQFNNDMFRK